MKETMENSKRYLKLKAHLNAAQGYARLSHARRLKVGAVLVRDDRIISLGYNGNPRGGPDDCETAEPVMTQLDGEYTMYTTKPEVVHAETNVIAFAAKYGVPTDGCSMVITDSPCYECSKLIIQSGIKEVYYEREYRDVSGIKFLKEYKVKVEKL